VSTPEQPPETPHHQPERGRLIVIGRRTDSGTRSTLLVINKIDGSWSFHGAGAPGVKLSKADAVAVCKSILERAR
jgi:hypothetical protein